MPALHPISVIARQLVGDPESPYRQPAVTTRQRPRARKTAAPVERAVTVRPQPSSWRSRLAYRMVHPMGAARRA